MNETEPTVKSTITINYGDGHMQDTKNILIHEVFIDQNQNSVYNDTDVHETPYDTIKDLFKALQSCYGRCVSKIYTGKDKGKKTIAIGWIFEKQCEYDDYDDECNKLYTREVWVTVHAKESVIHTHTEHFYKKLS